ncbi:hypothetical protein VTK73DRAFT_10328 [Phialemonium thermophilum]|uniref:CCHC-type domain-containing protein n=1 Tax=Phialemonium thermophilum TaxID=223376 RepID=A0ABR3VXA2_9PEZI
MSSRITSHPPSFPSAWSLTDQEDHKQNRAMESSIWNDKKTAPAVAHVDSASAEGQTVIGFAVGDTHDEHHNGGETDAVSGDVDGPTTRDCPEASSEPTTCRRCGEDGHMARECPQPLICKNCGGHGHPAAQCEAARKIDRSRYEDLSVEEAWNLIAKAAADEEADEVKEAIQTYVKAVPDTTYVQLEEAFRTQDLKLWLIAIEKPHLASTLTNMDLQGHLERKYTVTYRFSPNPPRPREREVWPPSPEENLERLKNAGDVVERGLVKCHNCGELGHTSKHCTVERQESLLASIKCYNCDGEGHRVRDCPAPRVDKFTCKNCGKGGHKAADCPEPRSADDVECRKCGEMGHFSRDCPKAGPRGCHNCGQEGHMSRDCTEPKNMDKVQCRNCDEYGHTARDCPKPRDMSRVKCSNCQEMGHFKSRCPNPLQEENDNTAFAAPEEEAPEVDTGAGGETFGGGWEAGAAVNAGGW